MVSLIAILISRFYESFVERATLSPQSKEMVARSQSLNSAMRPDVWPPGYPLLLLVARKIHYPLEKVNLLLFYLTLLLIFVISQKGLSSISPIWLPLFYSLCAFNYYNLAQYTSESIVIPLSLLVLLFLAAYLRRKSFLTILALSLCCSLLFVSRYQSMLWLSPIIVLHLVLTAGAKRKTILLHMLCFITIALGPVSIILQRNYQATGYLTGMDRLNWAARELPGSVGYYAASTGFQDNVLLTFKTLFLDFISPFQYATHEANRSPHPISGLEIAGTILLVLAVGMIAMTMARYLKCHGSLINVFRTGYDAAPLAFLAVEFFLGYILVTILVWTIVNNDPINTRFLYPSYIYLIISMFSGYAFVKTEKTMSASRFLFIGLFLYLIFVNLYKVTQMAILSK